METPEPGRFPEAPVTQDPAALEHIAKRIKARASQGVIVEELVQRGIQPVLAEEMVRQVRAKHAASMRRGAIVKVIVGVAVTLLFVGYTVTGYQRASQSGGTYYICWGMIVFGIALAVSGIIQLITGRERRV